MSTVIVVAWSPDDFGRAAAEHAVAEARLRGGTVVAVNATRGDALVDQGYAQAAELDQLRTSLGASGVPFDVRQSMGADVAEQVLEVAAELSAALVVVGVRRRTPVGKLLMGSTAQRVILGADCPVLAVKP